MSEQQNEALRDLMLAIEIGDHLRTFMPEDQIKTANRRALETLLAIIASGMPFPGLVSLIETLAVLSIGTCSQMRQRAGGRKLTNQAKRNRIASIVTLLRDSADRLEAVLLADGKVDHHAD